MGPVVRERQLMELTLAVNAPGQSHLRSPETFVFLTPGTTGPGSANDSTGLFQSKLAGGQNFGNEVLLDGASTARADSGSVQQDFIAEVLAADRKSTRLNSSHT